MKANGRDDKNGAQGAIGRERATSSAAGDPDMLATAELRLHPDTALVPEPSSEDWRLLLADVRERGGIVVPLEVTAAGIVLDGRLRLRAARQLAISKLPARVVSPQDERSYIRRAALARRHLGQGQKAALAVELAQYEQAKATARRRSDANLRRGNRAPEVAALPPRGEKTREQLARTAGVSERLMQDALTVKTHDAELFAQVKAGEIPLGKAARRIRQAQRQVELCARPPMPEGPFELIYADPPWQLDGDPESAWAPEVHYPTMPTEEIASLEVPAAKDAVLFLWTTCGVLPQALEVMAAWGFDYRANAVWVKPSPGIGNWVRYQHELLLIGRRGRGRAPDPRLRPASVIEAPKGAHSQKPELVYELLERLYPEARKLELFARTPRTGWAAFGNEVAG